MDNNLFRNSWEQDNLQQPKNAWEKRPNESDKEYEERIKADSQKTLEKPSLVYKEEQVSIQDEVEVDPQHQAEIEALAEQAEAQIAAQIDEDAAGKFEPELVEKPPLVLGHEEELPVVVTAEAENRVMNDQIPARAERMQALRANLKTLQFSEPANLDGFSEIQIETLETELDQLLTSNDAGDISLMRGVITRRYGIEDELAIAEKSEAAEQDKLQRIEKVQKVREHLSELKFTEPSDLDEFSEIDLVELENQLEYLAFTDDLDERETLRKNIVAQYVVEDMLANMAQTQIEVEPDVAASEEPATPAKESLFSGFKKKIGSLFRKKPVSERTEPTFQKPKEQININKDPRAQLQELREFSKRTELEPAEVYKETLENATEILRGTEGIKELPNQSIPTIIIPDLHARREHLVNILEKQDQFGATVLERLQKGELNLVCLGDGWHSENKKDWQEGAIEREPVDPNLSLLIPSEKAVNRDMVKSLGMMKMIQELKTQNPDNFHYIRGNHDDVMGSEGEIERDYGKYGINQTGVARDWVRNNYEFGENFLRQYVEWEKSLPLVVKGRSFVASHSAVNKNLAYVKKEDILKRERSVPYGFTWTDNTKEGEKAESSKEANSDVLKTLGMPEDTDWYIGHRKVTEDTHRRQDQLIQTSDNIITVVAADGSHEFYDISQMAPQQALVIPEAMEIEVPAKESTTIEKGNELLNKAKNFVDDKIEALPSLEDISGATNNWLEKRKENMQQVAEWRDNVMAATKKRKDRGVEITKAVSKKASQEVGVGLGAGALMAGGAIVKGIEAFQKLKGGKSAESNLKEGQDALAKTLTSLKPKDLKMFDAGISGLGYGVEKVRNQGFAKIFEKLAKDTSSVSQMKMFYGALHNNFLEDAQKAEENLEKVKTGKAGIGGKLGNWGALASNLKYGAGAVNMLVTGAMATNRLSGAAKETAIQGRKFDKTKETQIGEEIILTNEEIDRLHEMALTAKTSAEIKKESEANAEGKEVERDKYGRTIVSSSEMEAEINKQVPVELLSRLNNSAASGGNPFTRLAQKIAQIDIGRFAESIQDDIERIQENNKLTEAQKQEKLDKLFNGSIVFSANAKITDDYLRMVDEAGNVDLLAFTASIGERSAKDLVTVLSVSTLAGLAVDAWENVDAESFENAKNAIYEKVRNARDSFWELTDPGRGPRFELPPRPQETVIPLSVPEETEYTEEPMDRSLKIGLEAPLEQVELGAKEKESPDLQLSNRLSSLEVQDIEEALPIPDTSTLESVVDHQLMQEAGVEIKDDIIVIEKPKMYGDQAVRRILVDVIDINDRPVNQNVEVAVENVMANLKKGGFIDIKENGQLKIDNYEDFRKQANAFFDKALERANSGELDSLKEKIQSASPNNLKTLKSLFEKKE